MNKNEKPMLVILLTLLLVVTVFFLLFMLREKAIASDKPPVISCSSESIHVSISASDEELLAGVTAFDAEDGDLTDRIVIESISRFVEKGKSIITYAVFDSHNHVATASRELYFTDYVSPRFELTNALEFTTASSVNPLKFIKAYDCIDGDISAKISISTVNPDDYLSTVGSHAVEFRVTNSYGDIATLTTDIVVTNKTSTEMKYTPVINLSTYLVYIDKGEIIDPIDYVEGITVLDKAISKNELGAERFEVDMGDFDSTKAGLYRVIIYCEYEQDSVGSVSLLIAVTED